MLLRVPSEKGLVVVYLFFVLAALFSIHSYNFFGFIVLLEVIFAFFYSENFINKDLLVKNIKNPLSILLIFLFAGTFAYGFYTIPHFIYVALIFILVGLLYIYLVYTKSNRSIATRITGIIAISFIYILIDTSFALNLQFEFFYYYVLYLMIVIVMFLYIELSVHYSIILYFITATINAFSYLFVYLAYNDNLIFFSIFSFLLIIPWILYTSLLNKIKIKKRGMISMLYLLAILVVILIFNIFYI
ncbi:MAG: hypothetical protein ACP5RS_01230 [Thermoplasmata archaeon]